MFLSNRYRSKQFKETKHITWLKSNNESADFLSDWTAVSSAVLAPTFFELQFLNRIIFLEIFILKILKLQSYKLLEAISGWNSFKRRENNSTIFTFCRMIIHVTKTNWKYNYVMRKCFVTIQVCLLVKQLFKTPTLQSA